MASAEGGATPCSSRIAANRARQCSRVAGGRGLGARSQKNVIAVLTSRVRSRRCIPTSEASAVGANGDAATDSTSSLIGSSLGHYRSLSATSESNFLRRCAPELDQTISRVFSRPSELPSNRWHLARLKARCTASPCENLGWPGNCALSMRSPAFMSTIVVAPSGSTS